MASIQGVTCMLYKVTAASPNISYAEAAQNFNFNVVALSYPRGTNDCTIKLSPRNDHCLLKRDISCKNNALTNVLVPLVEGETCRVMVQA